MADIINLRTARKQQNRRAREKVAESNRVHHGLSSSERKAAKTLKAKQKRDLEGHRIIPGKSDD